MRRIVRGFRRRLRHGLDELGHRMGPNWCLVCRRSNKAWGYRGAPEVSAATARLVGGGARYVTCPFCGSYDRERLLYAYLQQNSRLWQGRRVLHIAHEENVRMLIEPGAVEYVTGDKLLPGEYGGFIDVQDMPFDDETFDLVICNHVLEHVENADRAMREILRVTKKSGNAILQIPWVKDLERTLDLGPLDSDQARLETYGQIDHVRMFGTDYPDMLRAAGWEVAAIPSSEVIDPKEFRRQAINPDEIVFLTTRPRETE